MISNFTGKYRFLSNFWPARVWLDGAEYRTVEHAYQAAKTFDGVTRRRIAAAASPGDAKRLGQKAPLREDWEEVKLDIMEGLLRQKFVVSGLREQLIATGNEDLVEGNTWGDCFWGVCRGKGENHLGRLLMEIRNELAAKEDWYESMGVIDAEPTP